MEIVTRRDQFLGGTRYSVSGTLPPSLVVVSPIEIPVKVDTLFSLVFVWFSDVVTHKI